MIKIGRDPACEGLRRRHSRGSNKLSLCMCVGWRSVIAQVDVLGVVFNRSVWRQKAFFLCSPSPPPLVVMLKVNKSLSGLDDSIH